MKKHLYSLFTIIFFVPFGFSGFSQSFNREVTGKVYGKNKQPLEYAIIKLVKVNDSLAKLSTLSNKEGEFWIKNLQETDYILKASFIGFKTIVRTISITKLNSKINLEIILEEGINLGEVVVEAEASAITVKKDTVEFNASSFKTAPDAVLEDLIKKLPGLEVDKDGNIKAQGEAIKKVTIDGRDFFGNDPKIATKNLPADAISKAQLIDEKSEEAKNTDIDDGKRDKVLNFVLKKDKKKGLFGNASLASGTEERYLGALSLNRFDNEKQFNVLMLSNNVNQSGFSYEDAHTFSGGSGGNNMYTQNANGELVLSNMNGINIGNTAQGLNKTNSGGVNYSDGWGKNKKLQFSSSYFGYLNSAEQESQSNSQNIQPHGTFFSTHQSLNNNSTWSHRFNSKLSGPIDSLTSFTFTPSITLNYRNSAGTRNYAQADASAQKINEGSSVSENNSISPSFNGSFNLNRKLRNRKGSISLFISNNYHDNQSENINETSNYFYQRNYQQKFNRQDNNNRMYNYFSVRNSISRVISKDKKTSLQLITSLTSNTSTSDNIAFEYNPVNGRFEMLIDSLTSNSTSKTYNYGPEIAINRNTSKWNIYSKADFQAIRLKGNVFNKSSNQDISRNYFNILPNASVSYRPKRNISYSLSVYGYANAPFINNLQLIQNNSNPLYIREGNPDLKSSVTYTSSFRYNASDPKTNRYTNFSINYRKMLNTTSNSTSFDSLTGIQRSKPVNVNGNYSFSMQGSFSIPTKIKNLRISPGFNVSSQRNQGIINNLMNNSDRIGTGGNLTLSYFYKEMFNITLGNRTTYTHVNNTAGRSLNNNYIILDNTGNFSFEPIKKWRINADVIHRSYAGQSFVLLNSGIQKFFMDKNRLALELKGFDLLNQNSDVNRNVYENFITDTRTNNINRHYYMKLTYKLNKIGSTRNIATPPPPIMAY